MTEAEKAEKTSSGQAVYASRTSWAISYLERAGYFTRISRGLYQVNDEGREAFKSDLQGNVFLQNLQFRIDKLNPWNTDTEKKESPIDAQQNPDAEMSPEEQIDTLVNNLNDSLSSELLDMILDREPDFFEKLVVDLLEKMGYGVGRTTQYVGDAGIDGIITTDALGFDPILTQAKRLTPGNSIGRPVIQSFAGALGNATRGVFITTSTFTREAVEWAKHYPHATIILIDGSKLTKLMIKYDLGVTTERTYEVKRIDSDYFEE